MLKIRGDEQLARYVKRLIRLDKFTVLKICGALNLQFSEATELLNKLKERGFISIELNTNREKSLVYRFDRFLYSINSSGKLFVSTIDHNKRDKRICVVPGCGKVFQPIRSTQQTCGSEDCKTFRVNHYRSMRKKKVQTLTVFLNRIAFEYNYPVFSGKPCRPEELKQTRKKFIKDVRIICNRKSNSTQYSPASLFISQETKDGGSAGDSPVRGHIRLLTAS